MATVDEMIKTVLMAGRDEGYMDDGDDISASNEIVIIYTGLEQVFNEDEGQEVDDPNNEIYEIYIHVDALSPDFQYPETDEFFGIQIGKVGLVHIRAVYEVDKDYLHFNPLEEYVASSKGVTLAKLKKVIKAAYEAVSD